MHSECVENLINKLFMRLEMHKGSLLFNIFAATPNSVVFAELSRCKNRKLTESWVKLPQMFYDESKLFLVLLK